MPFTTVVDKAAGDVFTEAMWDTYIKDNLNWLAAQFADELTYDQITADVTVSATTEATATTVITAAAVTCDGTTPVWVSFGFGRTDCPISDYIDFWLYQDGASIGRVARTTTQSVVAGRRRLTPAAGSRTFSIRATRAAGNRVITCGAGGLGTWPPGFIRVVKAAA